MVLPLPDVDTDEEFVEAEARDAGGLVGQLGGGDDGAVQKLGGGRDEGALILLGEEVFAMQGSFGA